MTSSGTSPVAPVDASDRPRPLRRQDGVPALVGPAGGAASARLRTGLLLLAPVLLVIGFTHFLRSTDPDYWWHVRTGQLIFETGSIPRTDGYSYTKAGAPWVAHEWLTELLMYGAERRVGYVGNVVVFGAVSALTWLIVYFTCRRRGIGELGATLLIAWGFVMALPSMNVRPQMLTALLLAVVALLVTRFREGDERALWPLPALFALWANLHGGFIIGVALLVMTTAGEGLARALGRPAAAPLLPLVTIAALSVLAVLLNPNGMEGALYPFSYAGAGNASMRYITEWRSPDFHAPMLRIFSASLLLAMLLGVWHRPLAPTDAIWALGFASLALLSVRHIPLYGVVVTPLLAARLQTEMPALRRSVAAWRRPAVLALTWIAVFAAGLGVLARPNTRARLQLGREPSAAGYPVGAVEYLRANASVGNLFNEYQWGGFLIERLYPRYRVFIDGRADVYGDELMDDYQAVKALRPNWRRVLERHDVRLVLVKKEEPLAVVLGDDAGWRRVYSGDVESLFVREAPPAVESSSGRISASPCRACDAASP